MAAFVSLPSPAKVLVLSDAVEVQALHTSRAQSLRLEYENKVLQYKNYQKSFLPSLEFTLSPFSFNRSIQRLQQPSDGSYTYVEDYSASSATGLTLHQKVGVTGGSFSIGTSLNYLHEFTDKKNSFNTRPFYISYNQPLWGGYRDYRFNRSINQLTYALASKQYAHRMVSLQQQVLSLYLECFLNKLSLEHVTYMAEASDTLMQVARLRRDGGMITDYDYKQIELSCAESALEQSAGRYKLESSLRALTTLLEMGDTIQIPSRISFKLPEVSADDVHFYIRKNNSSYLETELQLTEAKRSLWKARQENQINGTISVDYGVNQYGTSLALAYKRPSTQQSVGITLSFPLFQWGVEHNKRRMAENQYQIQENTVEQTRRDFENKIVETVANYNNVLSRCELAERTYRLAEENFRLKVRQFLMERISVTEMIDARRTLYGQMTQYYSTLHTLYTSYYEIKQMTLYDFKRHCNVWDKL